QGWCVGDGRGQRPGGREGTEGAGLGDDHEPRPGLRAGSGRGFELMNRAGPRTWTGDPSADRAPATLPTGGKPGFGHGSPVAAVETAPGRFAPFRTHGLVMTIGRKCNYFFGTLTAALLISG